MNRIIQKKQHSFPLLLAEKRRIFKCTEDDEEELIIPADSVCIIDIDEDGDCIRIWPDLMESKPKKSFTKTKAIHKQYIINQRNFIR